MISKAKLNKIRKAAGEQIKFLDMLPLDVQKKLTAEQSAKLCQAFAQVEKRSYESANAERLAQNVARFSAPQWFRKLKHRMTFDRIQLPALSVGVAAIRARFIR